MSRKVLALSPCELYYKMSFWGPYESSPSFSIVVSIKGHTREFLPKERIMLSSSKGLTSLLHQVLDWEQFCCSCTQRDVTAKFCPHPRKKSKGLMKQLLFGVGSRGSLKKWVNTVAHLAGCPLVFTLMDWIRRLEATPLIWKREEAHSLLCLGSSEKHFHSMNVQEYDIYVSAKTSGSVWWHYLETLLHKLFS